VSLQVSQEDGDTTVDVTEETDSIDPGLGFVVSFEGVVGDLPPGEFSVEATTVGYGSDIRVEGSLSVQADGSATSTARQATRRSDVLAGAARRPAAGPPRLRAGGPL